MNLNNRIFVAGLPRSGTTLVQNILDSHPNIYGGPEFDRIPNIIDLRNKLQQSFDAGRISSYTSKEAIDKAMVQLIDALFGEIETDKVVTLLSEKTPWNILFYDELFQLYPSAKFIMVMRNPLDIFNSMKNVALNAKKKGVTPPDFTTDYKLAVAYMEVVFGIMQRLLKKYPESFYLIRYEDLLTHLEDKTKELCRFIGVEWTHNLLEFHKIKHPGEENMTKDGVWYTKSMYNKDPKEVSKKASVLTFTERSFITYMFLKNDFVNPNARYFETLKTSARVAGKWVYNDYKRNYRFKTVPKRVLS
ncbi:MAG: sulfotransferase [Bacteroidota bacterium]